MLRIPDAMALGRADFYYDLQSKTVCKTGQTTNGLRYTVTIEPLKDCFVVVMSHKEATVTRIYPNVAHVIGGVDEFRQHMSVRYINEQQQCLWEKL